MRIVLLTSSLNAGGAERVAASLCNAWSARGDQVTIVVTYSGREPSFYELSPRVKLVYVSDLLGKGRQKWCRYVRKVIALRSLFRRAAPDVIVSFLQNVNVTALLSSAFLRVPVIACERSDPMSQPSSLLWKVACRFTYPFADLVTVQTSNAELRLKSNWSWLKRISAVPNPVPLDLERPVRSLRSSRPVLLSLGRLAPEKQVDKIISAFAIAAPDFPDWDLHIYGDGSEKVALAQQVSQLGMGDRVFLMGKTSSPWEKMASANAFVMASKYEGFPNALLEAMAIGLPCIATDCPSGPREISHEGRVAILVADGDLSQMVEAMRNLMRDTALRESMGTKARAFVLERFGLGCVLENWDRLFKTVGASE